MGTVIAHREKMKSQMLTSPSLMFPMARIRDIRKRSYKRNPGETALFEDVANQNRGVSRSTPPSTGKEQLSIRHLPAILGSDWSSWLRLDNPPAILATFFTHLGRTTSNSQSQANERTTKNQVRPGGKRANESARSYRLLGGLVIHAPAETESTHPMQAGMGTTTLYIHNHTQLPAFSYL
ncbi:uncharacterized protein CLUP02_02120 [Colletotrichum lupini]|uniref:Uncharacterized protein n=1 Tax=Colletotrichum lupini TaxID=145971 RepID=A0A9Q8SDN3_9PEZI|nr:uncharacterized protein CLUP02_02120 [Colletotrichum lupini]UQC75466.1 hypothetical protein CLUP02_02120 [Colletotrichum lupini]